MFSRRHSRAVFALLFLSAHGVAADEGAAGAATVTVARLADIAVYPSRMAAATVVSLNEAAVSAEIGGRVVAFAARVGEAVAKGATVARIDCVDYMLNREAAAARVAVLDARVGLGEARLRRTERLARAETVAEETLDEHTAELAVLRAERRAAAAQLGRARADVGRCVVTSPLHAVVTRRRAAEGEYVERGTPLLELVDSERLEVSARVSPRDVDLVREVARAAALPLTLSAAGAGGDRKEENETINRGLWFEDSAGRYPLTLRVVTPAIDPVTRDREARLTFTGGKALPGAAGKLAWRDTRPHVSAKLLVNRGGVLGVFVYADGQARFHRLPDARQGRASLVDLPADTLIITQGQFGLSDGQAVTVK